MSPFLEAEFLERSWQKEPALIRAAVPDFRLPLGPRDLKKLATEASVRSRLVTMPGDGANWSARSGPFQIDELDALPPEGWTLLVHEVDRQDRTLADLLDRFRFVPNWRIDDVMVSLAPVGGGVGPHVDRYDVFLLQGSGRRRCKCACSRWPTI